MLLTEESEALWYPDLAFQNVESVDNIKRTHIRHVFEVIPNDEFTFLAGDNNHIFNGSTNALSLKKEFGQNDMWLSYLHVMVIMFLSANWSFWKSFLYILLSLIYFVISYRYL